MRELSKKYYVNSAYLGQIFRKKFGQSFKEYLNNYRMEQAVQRLLYTSDKIYQIALDVGYKTAIILLTVLLRQRDAHLQSSADRAEYWKTEKMEEIFQLEKRQDKW